MARLNLPTLRFKNDLCNLITAREAQGTEKEFPFFFSLATLDGIKTGTMGINPAWNET